jgi:GntP family gluconate:H+ symporter
MDPLIILLVGMVVVVGGILFFRLHAFLALIAGALVVAVLTPSAALERYAEDQLSAGRMTESEAGAFPKKSVGSQLAGKFGETAGKVGILIAMASIIGKCLLASGAADRIVRSALALVGAKRAGLAFLGSGFVLSIPVFFDTVFYLLIPLGKAMALRNSKKYGLYIMAIVAGGTMAHSLVPPTPGPLLVAAELGIGIGKMMLAGGLLGIVTAAVGYGYAKWSTNRWPIPLRDSPEAPLAELEQQAECDEKQLPPFVWSILPIALPVLLIAGAALTKLESVGSALAPMAGVLGFVGDKNVALILSALVALTLLARFGGNSRAGWTSAVQQALASGGIIIAITSAGGAFGGMLQQSGIAERIRDLAPTTQALWILPMAFGVTALVRAAQGSATVAMITAVGILGSLGDPAQLGLDPIYLALAIGCGSKPFAWMNDSGFWTISRMSGMTERETLRSFSATLTVMGFAGLAVVMVAAAIKPLW